MGSDGQINMRSRFFGKKRFGIYCLGVVFLINLIKSGVLKNLMSVAPVVPEQLSLSSSSSSSSAVKNNVKLLDLPSSVKEVVINVGSNIDPIMPLEKMGPCAHAIAIEPIAGCRIPSHRQLSVISAAVADEPGVMSMRIYNTKGESSSLASIAKDDSWNSKPHDGKLALVPVITLSSVLNAIPETTKVAFMKTDMQGYDFAAVKEAANVLKKRVTHLMVEHWYNDEYTYDIENDFCRDWMPLMTELGYTLFKKDGKGANVNCEKQLRDNPQRPGVTESAGLNEGNGYWVRNDAVGESFRWDEIVTVQQFKPNFTEEDYAACAK